jgi:hypothetical protein
MPLSTEERERIREEEWVRAQSREDFRRHATPTPTGQNPFVGIGLMFAGILGVMGVFVLFIRLFGSL